MISNRFYIFLSIISASLIGCRKGPSTSGGCSGAQSLLSSESAIVDTEALVPAGGFLHIGSAACTATFLLESASSSELRFAAYTAQHCVNEGIKSTERFAVSMYVQNGSQKGYLQKLPVSDDFFTRRNDLWSAVRQLGSSEANTIVEGALLIPGYGEYLNQARNDDGSSEGGRDVSDIEAKNVCLSNRTDLLQVGNSQHLCWSALDTTVRRLTLRASEVGKQDFEKAKQHLQTRKAAIDSILRNSPQISNYFTLWNNRVHGQVGGWRLANYANIAAFLNDELCGKYLPKDAPEQSTCRVRDQLRALVEKHLVEVDIDGQVKSILKHAEQLGMGTSAPFFVDGSIPIKSALPMKSTENFFKFLNSKTADLRKFFPVDKSEKLLPLPKQFAVATNTSLFNQELKKTSLMFGLVKPEALFGETRALPSKGVNSAGLLRMYVSKQNIQIQFGATDSGAMITFAGIVPLLVLNTVDDKPTSGGSAILALPEIGYEDEASSSQAGNPSSTDQTVALNTSVKSEDALVKYGNVPCY